MSGYFIANYTVVDPEIYRDYQQKALPGILAFGGKVLVVGHSDHISEGEPQAQIIVIEFESLEVAKNWYYSSEYQEFLGMRLNSTDGGFGVLRV